MSEIDGSEAIGRWSRLEAMESSTWRELKAVYYVLCALADKLRQEHIRWKVDNMNVVHILHNGSMKKKLQLILLDIWHFSDENNIVIAPKWVPRSCNIQADLLSRLPYEDADDWKINFLLFRRLNSVWGPYTVDRFATSYNTKCRRFNSKIWFADSEAVDSFTVNWHAENNWLVPPPKLIISVLRKMAVDQAVGTIIVPKWRSAPFWPILFPDKGMARCVLACITFPVCGNVLPGYGKNGVFAKRKYNFDMIAVSLDFRSKTD